MTPDPVTRAPLRPSSARFCRPGRRLLVSGALLAALLPALVAPPSPAAPQRRTADQPRVGYALPADGTASGGWLGSRTVARRAVYRIDPAREPSTPRFGPGRWIRTPSGSGPVRVTRSRAQRAAWLLAKYGTYPSDAQAAAVEVAVHALLHGGAYGRSGSRTAERLRRSGAAEAIAPLADYMLERSRRLAGPYRVRVTATGAAVGDEASFAVRVTSIRSGAPIPGLPIDVRFEGAKVSGVTDDRGRVAAAAAAPVAGPRQARVTVRRLPTHRLLVRRPVRGTASRVVVAGRKESRTLAPRVAVQARPAARVSAPSVGRVPAPVPGTLRVSAGYPSPRLATLTLHGPFPTREEATCVAGSGVRSARQEVRADGDYTAPPLSVGTAGVYRWSVALAGNTYNLPAAACGERLVVKAVPEVSVVRAARAVAPGADTRARLSVSGLPAGYAEDVAVRLYGPFLSRDAVRCTEDRLARRRAVPVTAPATDAWTAPVRLRSPGVYAWRAVVPSTMLATRELTPCAAADTTFRVR